MINKILSFACLISIQLIFSNLSNGQLKEETFPLGDFLKGLKDIKPISGKLKYDTFPGFDFAAFKPKMEGSTFNEIRFVIGFSPTNEVESIGLLKGDKQLGLMTVHRLGVTRKIVTYQRGSIDAVYIFGFSPSEKFAVYLNTGFQYGHIYTISNVAAVHILRDDLFPVFIFEIWNRYIRVLQDVQYVNGRSKITKAVEIMFVYHPEDQKDLKLKNSSRFPEEYEIPRADFFLTLSPLNQQGTPIWVYDEWFHYN